MLAARLTAITAHLVATEGNRRIHGLIAGRLGPPPGAIRRRGLNVPGDLEVIGYRHDQSVLWPEVPTYRYPGEVLGEIGARMLLERLSGNGSPEVVTEHLTLEFVPATRPAGA